MIQPDEARRRRQGPLSETDQQRSQHRRCLEERQPDQPGSDQRIKPALAPAGEGSRSHPVIQSPGTYQGSRSRAKISLAIFSTWAMASGTGVSPFMAFKK